MSAIPHHTMWEQVVLSQIFIQILTKNKPKNHFQGGCITTQENKFQNQKKERILYKINLVLINKTKQLNS